MTESGWVPACYALGPGPAPYAPAFADAALNEGLRSEYSSLMDALSVQIAGGEPWVYIGPIWWMVLPRSRACGSSRAARPGGRGHTPATVAPSASAPHA